MGQVRFGAGNLGNQPKYDVTAFLYFQGINHFGNGCVVARELPVGQGTPLFAFNTEAGLETVSAAYFVWLERYANTLVKKATSVYIDPTKRWNTIVATWHTTNDSSHQGLPSDYEYAQTALGNFSIEPVSEVPGIVSQLTGPPNIWPWHFVSIA